MPIRIMYAKFTIGLRQRKAGVMATQVNYLEHEVDSLKSPSQKLALEYFNHLTKAIKAKLVYPSSSKLPEQFKDELLAKAKEVFGQIEILEYKVSSNSISYDEQIVYESSSRTENFAHLFFRDGLTNLRFYNGIDDDELVRFIELLARMLRTVYVDDDLATLLWEENFQYINYDLIDDGLDIDTIEYSATSFRSGKLPSSKDFDTLYVDESEITFDEEDFALAEKEMGLSQKGKAFARMPQASHDFLNRISEMTEAETNEIVTIVSDDSKINHTDYLITIIFELLGMEKELPGYTETLNFIGKVRDNFIDLGNFAGAAAMLEKMHEMQKVLQKLSAPRAEKINSFFIECASADKITLITETANKIKDIDDDGLKAYLKQLPWAAIDPLVTSLGDLKYYKARKAVCDTLVEIGEDQVSLIARGLEDERWFVVRNIVMVLGQIGGSRILNHLKKTIRHPDYRVRKETLKAAVGVRSEENVDFMILALSDPDTNIQMNSLSFLIEKRVTRAYKAIEHIIKEKKFKDRPAEHVKKFMKAYAALAQDKALPVLKPMATRSLFLISSKDERMKLMAISALGMINSAEAKKMLNKLSGSRNKKVSSAAMRAISQPSRRIK